jgi:DNA (cytosine-5)-methyltransferase 1
LKPRLLDLFCGAGGAAMGYHRAGFEVVGVDINPQPHYPFEFFQMDTLVFMRGQLDVPTIGQSFGWSGDGPFDAIHASPPCQPYSAHVTSASSQWNDTLGKDEPALIAETRKLLEATGLPYVIENVVGARRELRGPTLLCGAMFGLPIPRHRLFETSWRIPALDAPHHPDCRGIAKQYALARRWDPRDMTVTGKGRRAGTSARWSEVMGIDWHMSQHQLKEAIPPAYTEWIGRQLIAAIGEKAA